MTIEATSICPGCKVELPVVDGPSHPYMTGSSACFAMFNQILACEYSNRALMQTHRLTVDTFAVQHPGSDKTRQQIQSVGLHLARLGVQIDRKLTPRETNDVMLGLGKHKHTLEYLEPPDQFTITVADVVPAAGTERHSERVKAWASATWDDWAHHHSDIRRWTETWL